MWMSMIIHQCWSTVLLDHLDRFTVCLLRQWSMGTFLWAISAGGRRFFLFTALFTFTVVQFEHEKWTKMFFVFEVDRYLCTFFQFKVFMCASVDAMIFYLFLVFQWQWEEVLQNHRFNSIFTHFKIVVRHQWQKVWHVWSTCTELRAPSPEHLPVWMFLCLPDRQTDRQSVSKTACQFVSIIFWPPLLVMVSGLCGHECTIT